MNSEKSFLDAEVMIWNSASGRGVLRPNTIISGVLADEVKKDHNLRFFQVARNSTIGDECLDYLARYMALQEGEEKSDRKGNAELINEISKRGHLFAMLGGATELKIPLLKKMLEERITKIKAMTETTRIEYLNSL